MSCLIIVIDACREEYIDPQRTPFLYDIQNRGSRSRLEVTPSFAARVELLTGNSPASTDTFCDFYYDPDDQPFKLFRFLKVPSALGKASARREHIINYLRTQFYFYIINHGRKWIDFPPNIPLSLLSYFSVNRSLQGFLELERKRSTSHLFGILENNGIKPTFLTGSSEKIRRKFAQQKIDGDYALILHYMDLDETGHVTGPSLAAMKEPLKKIDKSISDIYNQLDGSFEFITVFGDHNMDSVEEYLDLWEHLRKLKSRIPEDYLVFLNSPVARFWFNNDKAKNEVRELLGSLDKYGREISKDEMRDRNLPVDEKYGEIIFWVKKGVDISPDYYHESKSKGMHMYFDLMGYTPFFMLHQDKDFQLESVGRLRDVMPTILDLLHVKTELDIDGRSLIREP